MTLQLDARPPSDLHATESQFHGPSSNQHAVPRDPSFAAPRRSTWVDGEYAMSDAAQRSRAYQSPVSATTATAPAADPAPAASAQNPAAPANDLARLGTGFGNTRPPQMLWNEHSVNVVGDAGRKQNGLDDAQAQTNTALAAAVFQASGETAAPLQLAPADLAMLLQASGLPYEKQDPGQLIAASRYINAAPDPGNQQERIRKSLDGLHILNNIGHPQLAAQEMKDLLWGAANVPGHAFGAMNQGEVAARYQDVATALNGAPGKHEVKIGKHNLKFTLDTQGQVTESSTKKPSVWGKIGRFALTVASFVPIPVIAIPARIASAAISAVEGIRNGNWMQAVAGVATGVAAGAGAIAGKAIAGVAATTAKVAMQVADAANTVQAGINAARGKNALGIFTTALQTTANAAGAFANGADAVADVAKQVQTWANRTLVGTVVGVNLKQGQIGAAISNGAALTSAIAGDFKNDDGSLKPTATSVQQYAGYGADAGRIVTALQQGNYPGALNAASGLATRIDTHLTPGPQTGPGATVAEYLNYAGSGVGIVQDVRQGRYETALGNGARLLDNITDGRPDAQGPRPAGAPDRRPGWAQAISEWLGYATAGVSIGRSVHAGSVDKALERTSTLLGQIDRNVSHDRANGPSGDPAFADTRTPLQRVRDWLDQAVAILRGKVNPAGNSSVASL